MRFLTISRLGLRRARRHGGLVLLVYLASLIPALLALSLFSGQLAPELDRSLFADRLLQGDSYAPWADFLATKGRDFSVLVGSLLPRWLLVTLLQILVSAGTVEALLERTQRHDHPFLAGIGRHGWRFVRAAFAFLLIAGPVLLLLRFGILKAFDAGDDRLQVVGWLVFALVGALVYAVFDLAYDFSRIAAAAHGEGRMLVGFLRALGFVPRHLGVLLPFYALFSVVIVALPAGYLAARSSWTLGDAAGVVLLLLLQQALMLLRSFLQIGLWGGAIAYFQGVGEPRWCGGLSWRARRREKRLARRRAREQERREPATEPPAA